MAETGTTDLSTHSIEVREYLREVIKPLVVMARQVSDEDVAHTLNAAVALIDMKIASEISKH